MVPFIAAVGARDGLRLVERHAVRDPGAAVVPDDGVALVAERPHERRLVGGQEGAKLEIASGEYNSMIDKRIAAIRAQCNLPA